MPPRGLRQTGDATAGLADVLHLARGRVDDEQPALPRAHPQAAIGGLQQRLHDVAVGAVHGCGCGCGVLRGTATGRGGRQRHRVEAGAAVGKPGQAAPGAHPQRAAAVHQQRGHAVVGQAERLRVMAVSRGDTAHRVEVFKPGAGGADPDAAVAAFGQRGDGGQGAASSFSSVVGDAVVARVVGGQAVGLGADPDAAVARREQGPHPTQVAAGGVGAVAFLGPELVAVVAHQAVAGGNPEEAVAVLCQRRHDVARDLASPHGLETRLAQFVGRRCRRAHGCAEHERRQQPPHDACSHCRRAPPQAACKPFCRDGRASSILLLSATTAPAVNRA